MTQTDYSLNCQVVHITQKGNNLAPKTIGNPTVTIQSKVIWVNHNYKFKVKDLTFLDFTDEVIHIETDKFTVELTVDPDQGLLDAFVSRLRKLFDKQQAKLQAPVEPLVAKRKAPAKPRSRVYGKNARAHQRILQDYERNQRNYFSDDEDDFVESSTVAQAVEIEQDLQSSSPSPPPVNDEKENTFEDQTMKNENDASVGDEDHHQLPHQSPQDASMSGGTKRKKRRLLKSLSSTQQDATSNADDSDSDDDLFREREMTTPGLKNNIVTPRTAIIEDDDDDSIVEDEPGKGQGTASIRSFFQARTPTKPKQPLALATIQKFASPIQTPLSRNDEWLHQPRDNPTSATPTKKLAESPDSPIATLTAPSTPPTTLRKKLSTPIRLRDDDIEDDDDDDATVSTTRIIRKRFVHKRNRTPLLSGHGSNNSTANAALATPTSMVARRVDFTPKGMYSTKRNLSFATTTNSIYKGLRNLGNTCYLNASLQLLFTIRDFMNKLDTTYSEGPPVTNCMSTLAKSLLNNGAGGNPRALKKAIDLATNQFSGYEQRDAHELLSFLVDHVHDELEAEKKKKAVDEAKADHDAIMLPTDEYFRLNLNVCLKCDKCGYTRSMEEMYRHLSVEVHRKPTEEDGTRPKWEVAGSLEKFFQPEQRDIKCEKCEEGTTASQNLEIKNRPKALILQLKRFVVRERPQIKRYSRITNTTKPETDASDTTKDADAENQPPVEAEPIVPEAPIMVIQKNKDPVVVAKTINLDSYCADGVQGLTYNLKAIVHHHGATPSSGHYTADALRIPPTGSEKKDPEWINFDDSMTSEIQINKALRDPNKQRSAYLLLYMLDDE